MELTNKEKNTGRVISKVVNGEITRKEAQFELGKSRQQIYRLISIYNEEGKEGFAHKGRSKKSKKKIDRNIVDELENLYLNEYYDFNLVAFYDEINEKEKYKGKYNISYSSLYNAFLNDDIISPIAHKGTIKLYNEKMNNAIESKEEKVELFQSRQLAFETE